MPSLDLFDPTAHPDGWHDVRAPGGYEWWYFDAEDAATDTRLVAIFMQGFIFHPGYIRAYERFRKHPTRTPPPTASDFPCVYLCVYRGGSIWRQFFTQYRREDFAAKSDGCDVRIGENNYARRTPDGYELYLVGAPWRLTARGPVTAVGEALSAKLTFAAPPMVQAAERPFLSKAMTGAEHRWAVVAPRCAVSGTLRVTRAGSHGGGSDVIDFAGRGYHDHNYGTAPIGEGVARWTWGRAMFGDDRVVTFHHAEAGPRRGPATNQSEPGHPRPERAGDGPALTSALASSVETHLVEADARGTRDLPVDRVVADFSPVSNAALFLRYPALLDFGPALRLSEPRIVDPSPFYLRLTMMAESFGQRSTAFCEVAYPYRLRWPLLGRMIEMSFDKRPTRPDGIPPATSDG